MITKKQYLEAKAIVEEYQRIEYQNSLIERVKLSAWGRQMQSPHNKKGIVVEKSGNCIWVIWEDGKREGMDKSQVERIYQR